MVEVRLKSPPICTTPTRFCNKKKYIIAQLKYGENPNFRYKTER